MIKLCKFATLVVIAGALAASSGCTISAGGVSLGYEFSGASIPNDAKTFSVAYFPNNAPLVAPTLSNTLTEALKDRFTRQTRLGQVSEGGDLAFEGEITGYSTAPAAVSADEEAIKNRLTITVNVRFFNVLEPELSFEQGQSFTAFTDYDTTQDFQSIQTGLIEEIVEMLVDNIFNASVAQW